MKIVTVVGARPQFVKAAAVSRAISIHNQTCAAGENVQEILVHTGQHFDQNMSDVFFEEMQIPRPDYQLEVNSLSHGAMTGRMLEKIEELLLKEKPDYVMVYGDTNSTFAGALAATKIHHKVVHIEAGLRSFNKAMPEEVNRILTDHISDILCCPTVTAVQNLENEGLSAAALNVANTGDVMLDAATFYSKEAAARSTLLKKIGFDSKEYLLCTIHRAENTDSSDRLNAIISALNEINSTLPVVMPLHPRTRKILKQLSIEVCFTTIDPVGYYDMLELIKNCKIVASDSGGLQKEAYFFGKRCIVLRDETEWTELVDNNCNIMAGADKAKIIESIKKYAEISLPVVSGLYGNADAADKIVKLIVADYCGSR